jgi:acetyl-CoA carboxylase alpha subunit
MAVADRVLALSNAVFSVIAPEGAAAILYRDAARAPELAERLKMTATDLEAFALVDRLIEEEPGVSAKVWNGSMQDAIAAELDSLAAAEPETRLARRAARWRDPGANIVAM